MGVQPESRAILGHLLNVSMPFSKDDNDRVWALICNTEELEESFDPDFTGPDGPPGPCHRL